MRFDVDAGVVGVDADAVGVVDAVDVGGAGVGLEGFVETLLALYPMVVVDPLAEHDAITDYLAAFVEPICVNYTSHYH